MNELIPLVRRSLTLPGGDKQQQAATSTSGSTDLVPAQLQMSMTRSSFMVPLCGLCGVNPLSPFLAAAEDSVSSSASASPPRGAAGGIRVRDLCVDCFRVAFKAIVRPLLADEVHRCRLASVLEATADATKDADAAAAEASRRLALPVPSSNWTCPRCTYAGNPSKLENCEVCGTRSPFLTQCIECGLNLTQDRMGKPCPSAPPRTATSTAVPLGRPVDPRTTGGVGCFGTAFGAAPRPRPPPIAGQVLPQPVHAIWQCNSCTLVNTVDTDSCKVCSATRGWECPRCTAQNYSRRAPNGERCCNVCGGVSIARARTEAEPTPGQVAARREAAQQRELDEAHTRLDQRLRSVGLTKSQQAGDGNCQFRALAHQLFGTPALHMFVRHTIIMHMLRRAREDFEPLFDSKSEFESYVTKMSCDGTWGDEMTLRAAADALGCHVHVITSDMQRWHLHFEPKQKLAGVPAEQPHQLVHAADHPMAASQSMAMGPALALETTVMLPVRNAVAAIQRELTTTTREVGGGSGGSVAVTGLRSAATTSSDVSVVSSGAASADDVRLETTRNLTVDWPDDTEDGFPHVFLAYQYPVHYDDVHVLSSRTGKPRPLGCHTVDMCRLVSAVLTTLIAEEREWVDASGHHPPLGSSQMKSAHGTTGDAAKTDDWVHVGGGNSPSGPQQQQQQSSAPAALPPADSDSGRMKLKIRLRN